jgi:hypothetical protein
MQDYILQSVLLDLDHQGNQRGDHTQCNLSHRINDKLVSLECKLGANIVIPDVKVT